MSTPIIIEDEEYSVLLHQWKDEKEDILRTAWRESDSYVHMCINSLHNCGAGYATCGAIAYVIKYPGETRADWKAANSAERYLHKLEVLCRNDGDTVTHLGRMPFIVRQRIKKLTGSDDLTK
jgi:hypothetical protein